VVEALGRAVGDESAGVVVLGGKLVHRWGDFDEPQDWGSATKPFVSTLLLIAVQQGKLASADEPIRRFVDGLVPPDDAITFRHLANMTSGYSLPEPPGESWEYNDYAIKLYFVALFEGALGLALDDVAALRQHVTREAVLGPLGFEDGDLLIVKNGVPRLHMSPRDYARVGWMWCLGGAWNGRQLIDRDLFAAHSRPGARSSLPRSRGSEADDYLGLGTAGSRRPVLPTLAHGPGSYGFNWWFNEDRALWPSLPPDAFQANGHWNLAVLTVVPSLGLVVAWVGGEGVTDRIDGRIEPAGFTERIDAALAPLVRSIERGGRVDPCRS
jgi:CubicO group peptidase (beta-lactamase class C family)